MKRKKRASTAADKKMNEKDAREKKGREENSVHCLSTRARHNNECPASKEDVSNRAQAAGKSASRRPRVH